MAYTNPVGINNLFSAHILEQAGEAQRRPAFLDRPLTQEQEQAVRLPFTPYFQAERSIFSHGLWNYLSKTYLGAQSTSLKPDAGLRAVYRILTDKVGRYMSDANTTLVILQEVADPVTGVWREPAEIKTNYSVVAELAKFLVAEQSAQSGDWFNHSKRQRRERVAKTYLQTTTMADEDLLYICTKARIHNQQRARFWRREVELVETHPYVQDLLAAIKEAEVYEEPEEAGTA